MEELGERVAERGRVLGRLPDDRVAAQDRRHQVPGGDGDREVAGGDDRGDADRHPEREQLLVRHLRRHGLAVQAPALADEEVAGVDDLLHLAERLGVGLADLARDEPRRAPPCWPRRGGRRWRSRARARARAPCAQSRCAARAARQASTNVEASPSRTSATVSDVLAGFVEVRRPPGASATGFPSTIEPISVPDASVVMRSTVLRPPSQVSTTRAPARSSNGSRSRITRSASMPGRSRPRRSALPSSHAGVTVSASSAACRSSASCGRHSRRTASRRPCSGSISSTGASEPSASRAPRRVQRAVGVGALEPVGPQPLGDRRVGDRHRRLDRGGDAELRRSAGCRRDAGTGRARSAAGSRPAPPRTRRAPRGWRGRRSRARRPARPPRVAARTISSNASRLVISTPVPSSSRAVCEPSVPSMYALT